MNSLKSRSKTGRHLSLETKKKISEALKRVNIPSKYKLKSYNLTIDEWLLLKERQENKCAICKQEFSSTPCVDHDHKTGKVRGLLCQKCNKIMGQFNDNVSTFQNAVIYLTQSNQNS